VIVTALGSVTAWRMHTPLWFGLREEFHGPWRERRFDQCIEPPRELGAGR
jgi:hypothetical protein